MSNYFNSEDFTRLYKKLPINEINKISEQQKTDGLEYLENLSITVAPVDEDVVLTDVKFEDLEIKDVLINKPEEETTSSVEDDTVVKTGTTEKTTDNNSSNAQTVNKLKSMLPDWLITNIENELSEYESGSAEYNEKFIEKAYSMMKNDNSFSDEMLKNLGLEDFDKIDTGTTEKTNKNEKALNRLQQANAAEAANDATRNAANNVANANNNVKANNTAAANNVGAANNATAANNTGTTNNTRVANNTTTATATADVPANNRAVSGANYSGMSEEQLQEKLTQKQGELDARQGELNDVMNGSNEWLNSILTSRVNPAYDAYMQELELAAENSELAKELQTTVQDVTAKEKQINETDAALTETNASLVNATTDYDNAVSRLDMLNNSKASLQSADTSNMNDYQKGEIQASLANIEAEIATAEAEKRTAEETKNKLEQEKEKLENDKNTFQGELDKLNETKADLEKQVAETMPNVASAMNKYNSEKTQYENSKASRITQLEGQVSTAQAAVTELKNAIAANKDRDLKIEYSSDITGRDRIKYAKEFLGYREEDSSADIFLYKWHSSSKEVGWCAGFVDYVLTKNPSADQTKDWYMDITNTYWQVNVDNAARNADAFVDPQNAKAGDVIVFDYDKDNSMDHIALVIAVEGDKIITIDGNSGNMVRINETNLSDPRSANIRICRA